MAHSSTFSTDQDKWLIRVYRYTKTSGWEYYQDTSNNQHLAGVSETSQNERHTTTNSSHAHHVIGGTRSNYQVEPVTVTPRVGCIEIKRLRLRLYLFPQPAQQISTAIETSESATTTTSNSKKAPPSSSKVCGTTVIKRRDTILLSTKKEFGAVVLQFLSVAECTSFIEKLVSLNRGLIVNPSSLTEQDTLIHSNHSNYYDQPKRSDKRVTININGVVHKSKPEEATGRHSAQLSNTKNDGEQITPDADSNLVSYIARLLHDQSFLNFVNTLEQTIKSSPDGKDIWKALGYHHQVLKTTSSQPSKKMKNK